MKQPISNQTYINDKHDHSYYMNKAIELSKKGIGFVNPNPLVGAIIVKKGKIIGEGYHKKYGHNHAEINALNSCRESLKGATMYVSLEPCCHYGKTPPCVEAIIESGIEEVVIGMKDPNPLVAGKGINYLIQNGIKVTYGILEEDIKKLNKIFIKYITTNKPYCILKTAMTLDGKIATVSGDSKWISNEKSREYVHKIRHQVSSIMVGIGTIIADNPSLTTRLNNNEGVNPTRIIVDTKCRIPLDAKVISEKGNTIIATTDDAPLEKRKELERKGVCIQLINKKDGKVDLEKLVCKLGEMGIDSILLEGGSELNYSALNTGIVDEVIAFIAPKIIGGKEAKTPIGGEGISKMNNAFLLDDIEFKKVGEDLMIKGKVTKH
ncbi:MAG: bifunctional diaminohydroxyphosphoribosylaminopyrimidine deaminase/5-amino-6-(5-phosphoribosylamino)uracil reductase RibD [Vallitalea sp.]|nr:bifunctional diaminohydroxyphosphoribosylaminopyrimidine deaminase/5-amino-6-(5-phosphoribosylamino)uracil reductase RibD [Vallitalea sp.]